jgi:hypothetical protein
MISDKATIIGGIIIMFPVCKPHSAPTQSTPRTRCQVKVFTLVLAHHLLTEEFQSRQEALLSEYLNGGWQIIASGGYGGDPGGCDNGFGWGMGFLILQKPTDDGSSSSNGRGK